MGEFFVEDSLHSRELPVKDSLAPSKTSNRYNYHIWSSFSEYPVKSCTRTSNGKCLSKKLE